MSCDRSRLEEIQGESERVKFFDASQTGGKASSIFWNGWRIWEDGSAREMTQGFTGLLRDASWIDENDIMEVKQTLWFRIRYYQVKLDDAVKIFEAAKIELQKRASDASVFGGQPPDESELKQVRRLRHNVQGLEKKLEELFNVLNPQSEPYLPSEAERKRMDENRSEGDKILNALKIIEI